MIAFRYSDWYTPRPDWAQPAVDILTVRTEHLLYLDNPQPNPGDGSLCTVMMATSPWASLHWAKIPCDVPMRAGSAICKTIALHNGKPTIFYFFVMCRHCYIHRNNSILLMSKVYKSCRGQCR